MPTSFFFSFFFLSPLQLKPCTGATQHGVVVRRSWKGVASRPSSVPGRGCGRWWRWVGEEEQMGGERWPAAMSSKGASWFRGWGEMRKKRKEPVETAAGQRADWETPISRGLFPPIYIFLVTIELEHVILVLIIFKSGRRPLEARADCAHFCAWLPQTTPWSEQCNCHSLIYHKMSAPVIAGCEIIFNFL